MISAWNAIAEPAKRTRSRCRPSGRPLARHLGAHDRDAVEDRLRVLVVVVDAHRLGEHHGDDLERALPQLGHHHPIEGQRDLDARAGAHLDEEVLVQRRVRLAREDRGDGARGSGLAGRVRHVDEDQRAEVVRVDDRVVPPARPRAASWCARAGRRGGKAAREVLEDEARGVRVRVDGVERGGSGGSAARSEHALKTGSRASVPCATPYGHISRCV